MSSNACIEQGTDAARLVHSRHGIHHMLNAGHSHVADGSHPRPFVSAWHIRSLRLEDFCFTASTIRIL